MRPRARRHKSTEVKSTFRELKRRRKLRSGTKRLASMNAARSNARRKLRSELQNDSQRRSSGGSRKT